MKKTIDLSKYLKGVDGSEYSENGLLYTGAETLSRGLKTAIVNPKTKLPYTSMECIKFLSIADDLDKKGITELDQADIETVKQYLDGMMISAILKAQIYQGIEDAKDG